MSAAAIFTMRSLRYLLYLLYDIVEPAVQSEVRQKWVWQPCLLRKLFLRVNHSLISRVSHKPLAMNRSYSAVHFHFQPCLDHLKLFQLARITKTCQEKAFLWSWRVIGGWPCDSQNLKPTKVRELREFYKSDQNKTAAFCRCQMSDDFSERGHMVNFISGSYWLNWKLNMLFVWKYFPKSRSISIVLLTSITTFQLAAL